MDVGPGTPLQEIRRGVHLPTRFSAEVQATGTGIRCLVEFPSPNPGLAPIFKHKLAASDHLSEHPSVRVYDEYLSNPNAKPETQGRVTHVCVVGLDSPIIRHLLSVVETKTNVMLFPAWGKNPMRLLHGQTGQPAVPVGHVTWNKAGQQLRVHRSGGARHGGGKKVVGSSTQLRSDQGGYHAARLGVRSLTKLDRTGIGWIDVPASALGSRSAADIESVLVRSLSEPSVVVQLPPEWGTSMEGRHLEVCAGMKASRFVNEELPRPAKPLPVANAVEQVLKVPLSPPWNLLLQFRLVAVPVEADFAWSAG